MSGLVVLPDEGKSVHFGGTGAIYKLLGEQTSGTLALVEHTVAPNTPRGSSAYASGRR